GSWAMAEPLPEIDRALAQVGVAWDEARTERTLEGARSKRAARRRRLQVVSALGAVTVIAACAGVAWLGGFGAQPRSEAVRTLQLDDGSRALLLDSAARVVVSEVAPTSVVVRLPEGRARFDVVPRPERSFRVRCGDVEVEVLGTSFELTR